MIVTARRCLRALPEPVASNITPVKPTTDVLADSVRGGGGEPARRRSRRPTIGSPARPRAFLRWWGFFIFGGINSIFFGQRFSDGDFDLMFG